MRQLHLHDSEQDYSMVTSGMPSERPSLKDAVSQLQALAKRLNDVAGVNLRTSDALDELENALQKVPPGAAFGEALDEARAALNAVIAAQRAERAQAFGRLEAEFVRGAGDRGGSVREQNEGWRIGKLEFQFRRAQAMARALYNHEEIVSWKPIGELTDLEKLENAATKRLTAAELPVTMLITVFWSAYETERDRRTRDRKTRPELVPLVDFYRELRSALVRFELAGQKPDRRLQFTELPRWMFLYNLDRYRAEGSALPPERRLGFQTGSQQDVQRGLGFSINGLNASQDYKTVCYVMAV
jgi:hypothetical protein